MIGRGTLAMLLAVAVVGLPACGDKPQGGGGAVRKSDTRAWEGPSTGAVHAAEGFKAGDKTAWEAQLKARAERGQNEYSRTAAGKN
jgi:hypothetical protein